MLRSRTQSLPKAIHDWKAATHALRSAGIALRGVQHDPMLYSYLLDPTYSSHRLADVALRRFNLKLSGTLPEGADITGRLATALRREVEEAGLLKLYEEIDLPLVPVLARMEQAGVKIDRKTLAEMSSRLEREIDAKAKEIYECCGLRIQYQLAEATRRCAVQQAEPAQAGEVRQRENDLHRSRRAGRPGRRATKCRGWCLNTGN